MAKPETAETTWNQYGQGWTQYAKDAAAIQIKTAQFFLDQSVKLSQTFADFYQTQASEGLKLSQACFNTGKEIATEARKTAATFAEKATGTI